MSWSDTNWRCPRIIVEECSNDEAARQRGRDNYLKTQDIEAQLVAAGIFDMKRAFFNLILTLDKKLEPTDGEKNGVGLSDEAEPELYELYEPDFEISAVVSWIKHTGQKVYENLSENRTENWSQNNISCMAKHFNQPIERWSFWENRLVEVAKDGPDDLIRNSAELAVKYMQDIKDASEKKRSQ